MAGDMKIVNVLLKWTCLPHTHRFCISTYLWDDQTHTGLIVSACEDTMGLVLVQIALLTVNCWRQPWTGVWDSTFFIPLKLHVPLPLKTFSLQIRYDDDSFRGVKQTIRTMQARTGSSPIRLNGSTDGRKLKGPYLKSHLLLILLEHKPFTSCTKLVLVSTNKRKGLTHPHQPNV